MSAVMPLISRNRLQQTRYVAQKSLDDASRELKTSSQRAIKSTDPFDVFLSHRYLDAREVLALKIIIEAEGLSVYVDWIDSPQLSRRSVTRETALVLRRVILRSKSLLYVHTENATDSKWMPWELGCGDGGHGKVAIIPVTQYQGSSESFSGQEYLAIYPYMTLTTSRAGQERLYVRESAATWATLSGWLKGEKMQLIA